jgi:hypothetical protein
MACPYCGLDHVLPTSPTTGEHSHGACVMALAKKLAGVEGRLEAIEHLAAPALVEAEKEQASQDTPTPEQGVE